MKKVTTILKQIDELEKELYKNYSPKEIMDGFNKLVKEGFRFSLTSLLIIRCNIYRKDYLRLDEEFPDE